MKDGITAELAKLHVLKGADFSRQVERIALRKEFYNLKDEKNIFVTGYYTGEDYENLLSAARKAVEYGYRVFILPNPQGIRTPDFIFAYKNIYITYDLKTIRGKSSVGTRLLESIGQSNRVLLHMTSDYNARLLASDLKAYFEANSHAIEVLIFKGKKKMSITRRFVANPMFNRLFRRMYEK